MNLGPLIDKESLDYFIFCICMRFELSELSEYGRRNGDEGVRRC